MDKKIKSGWELKGGDISIPDGCFISHAEFDCEDPYIILSDIEVHGSDRKCLVPKSLAYYLSTHSCGSKRMREIYIDMGKNQVRKEIKNSLDIS